MQQNEQLSIGIRAAARRESAKLVESLNQESLYDQYIYQLSDFFRVPHALIPETPGVYSPLSALHFADVARKRHDIQIRSTRDATARFHHSGLEEVDEHQIRSDSGSSAASESLQASSKVSNYDIVAFADSAAPVSLLYQPTGSSCQQARFPDSIPPFPAMKPVSEEAKVEVEPVDSSLEVAAAPMPPQESFEYGSNFFIPLIPEQGVLNPQTNFFDFPADPQKDRSTLTTPRRRQSSASASSTVAAGPNMIVKRAKSRTVSRSQIESRFFAGEATQSPIAAALHPALIFNVSEVVMSGIPPRKMIEKCILSPIKAHCEAVSSTVQAMLVRSCFLAQHLTSARSFFAQEHGLLFSMYKQTLFRDLREAGESTVGRRKKYGASALNMLFQQCLDNNGGSSTIFGSDLVSIRLAPAKAQANDAVDILLSPRESTGPEAFPIKSIYETDRIQLHYAVEWPLNFFINAKTMTEYNKVFSLLMRISRAEFELQRHMTALAAKTKRIYRGDVFSQVIHKMQLLRMRLLHFVQTLRSYVGGRVLQTAAVGFGEIMSGARDLEHMLSLHNEFLQTLLERCMLSEPFSAIRSRVDAVLDLALLFGSTFDVEALMRSSESGNTLATSHLVKAHDTIDRELDKAVSVLLNVLGAIAERRRVTHRTFPAVSSFSFALTLLLVDEFLLKLDYNGFWRANKSDE